MSASLDAASRGKRARIVAIWPSDSEGTQTEELKIASCSTWCWKDPSPSHSNVTALHVCWSQAFVRPPEQPKSASVHGGDCEFAGVCDETFFFSDRLKSRQSRKRRVSQCSGSTAVKGVLGGSGLASSCSCVG